MILVISGISCVSEKKTSDFDYSGIYKLSDVNICDLTITIKKKNGDNFYTINGAGLKRSGKLSIEKDGDAIYLNFNGTLRSGDRTVVTGAYSDKTITIQNTGNSMNNFVCFKKCDAKYLEFIKTE